MSNADSPQDVENWEALARRASLEDGEEEGAVLLRELLSFRLADTPYAIPVERVREIVRLRDVTSVPHMPRWVIGVVGLRGEVVQVVDLRMRLGIATSAATRSTRVIVLHGDDERVTGILVDAVDQVLRISEELIRPAAGAESGAVIELCERDGEFISVVDVDRVLELRED